MQEAEEEVVSTADFETTANTKGGDHLMELLIQRPRTSPRKPHSSAGLDKAASSVVFRFQDEDFVNAVVTPVYRNLDQPLHYYVTDIRSVIQCIEA